MFRNNLSGKDAKAIGRISAALLVAGFWALVAWMLCGCTATKYVPVESVSMRTDTLRVQVERVDSVYLRDSVNVAISGATVWIEKYRDRFRYRFITDTLERMVQRVDSVAVPYPVERDLTSWQKLKMQAGGICIIAIALCVVGAAIWIILKTRRI